MSTRLTSTGTGTGTGTATTTTTTTTTPTGAEALAETLAAEQSAWWVAKVEAPPQLDRSATRQAVHQCSVEVGACQLVVKVDDAEAARLRVAGAQYSTVRIEACGDALEALGTATDKVQAVEIERQAADIAELATVQSAHEKVWGSYGATIAKRGLYLMDQVRVQEERILLLGAQERVKPSPDPKILTAANLVESARQREAGRKQATQQDHESRTGDKDATIARLERDLDQLRRMNEELVQGLARVKADQLSKDAGAALGGSAASTASSSESASGLKSSDRRQGGR